MAKYHYVASDRVNDGGATVNRGELLGSMEVVEKIDPRFAASLVDRGATQRTLMGVHKLINEHLCEDGMVLAAGAHIADIKPVAKVGIRVFAALVAAGKAKVSSGKLIESAKANKIKQAEPEQVAFKKA